MIKYSVRWVKAHQDDQTPYAALSPIAQLNVKADNLATLYLQAMKRKSTTLISCHNPYRLKACPMHLTINGQDTTAHAKEALRFHINGTALRKYLQKKHIHWTDRVWETIDLLGFRGAVLSTSTSYQLKLRKLIHGWPPKESDSSG
jgi:hypothetical protein